MAGKKCLKKLPKTAIFFAKYATNASYLQESGCLSSMTKSVDQNEKTA
jgi:hypothetical protein